MKKCSLCGIDIEPGAAQFFTWGDHTMIAVICGDGWCDDSLHRWASDRSTVLATATPDEMAAGKLWGGMDSDDKDAKPFMVETTADEIDQSLPTIRHDDVTEWSSECVAIAEVCFDLASKTDDTVLAYDLGTLSSRLEKLKALMEAAKRGEDPPFVP